jgi:hypothetical protein
MQTIGIAGVSLSLLCRRFHHFHCNTHILKFVQTLADLAGLQNQGDAIKCENKK